MFVCLGDDSSVSGCLWTRQAEAGWDGSLIAPYAHISRNEKTRKRENDKCELCTKLAREFGVGLVQSVLRPFKHLIVVA